MTAGEGQEGAPAERKKPRGRPPKGDTVDPAAMLGNLLTNANLGVTPQTDEERASKLKIAEQEAEHDRDERKQAAKHRRRIELIALVAVLAVSGVVCPVCLWELKDPSVPPERKMWAGPILTLVIGGLMGFLTGRVPVRPPEK